MSKVKSLLHYWFDKAFFHRPTVIVFDNIDKLMGAEQEVSRGTYNAILCTSRPY